MTGDSETVTALRRAGKRVVYHLAMAGVEGLKALQAVVDELASIGSKTEQDGPGPQRIEIE
ncbi:MAG: hypothetical protein ACT4OP_08625 [Actinomycetota bacterium]